MINAAKADTLRLAVSTSMESLVRLVLLLPFENGRILVSETPVR